ncbi:hypothetical protein ABT174_12105 [Streptomyces sparsogenes]|uniref:hypothetical protein n=1 Tax=Streptomyces sparsogenes TaxID=67365 RepID=UPI00333133CB
MGQGRILNRGARVFGALVCAVLGLISLAWIIRDFDKADEASDVWWTWAGMPYGFSGTLFASSLADLLLLAVYLRVLIVALRSADAAGALGSAALATVALRLPSLWNLDAEWMRGIPEELKTRAQLSAWTAVLLGAALLVVVAVGRRPVGGPVAEYYAVPPTDRPPTRPTPGGGGTAALFLGAAAVIEAAWQIYFAQKQDWDVYKHLLTGKYMLTTLLAPPGAWASWTVALLALAGAFAALGRAAPARPLGMTAAALVLGYGIAALSLYIKFDYVDHFDDLETVGQLSVLTAFFEILAGLVVLIALAQPGVPADEPPAGWGQPAAPPYGGYGGADGGYGGYGNQAGADGGYGGYGNQAGADGGYGYGPPPASPPPPPAPPAPPAAPPTVPPPPSSPPPPPPPGW